MGCEIRIQRMTAGAFFQTKNSGRNNEVIELTAKS